MKLLKSFSLAAVSLLGLVVTAESVQVNACTSRSGEINYTESSSEEKQWILKYQNCTKNDEIFVLKVMEVDQISNNNGTCLLRIAGHNLCNLRLPVCISTHKSTKECLHLPSTTKCKNNVWVVGDEEILIKIRSKGKALYRDMHFRIGYNYATCKDGSGQTNSSQAIVYVLGALFAAAFLVIVALVIRNHMKDVAKVPGQHRLTSPEDHTNDDGQYGENGLSSGYVRAKDIVANSTTDEGVEESPYAMAGEIA